MVPDEPPFDGAGDRDAEVARTLSPHFRRELMTFLADESSPVSIDEIVHHLHAEEPGVDQGTESLRHQLHQVDIPALEEADLVDYRADESIVALSELGEDVVSNNESFFS